MKTIFQYISLIAIFFLPSLDLYSIDEGRTIAFDLVEGMILVDGSIQGKTGSLIFDTGSSGLIIHRTDLETLEEAKVNTVAGEISVGVVPVSSFSISGLSIEHVKTAMTMDLSHLSNDINRDIIGIFGWSLLSNAVITIDYELQQIIVGKPTQMDIDFNSSHHILKLNMQSVNDDLPTVEVLFRNKKMVFAFDTGAPLNVIDSDHVLLDGLTENQAFSDGLNFDKNIRVEDNLFKVKDLKHFNHIDGILSVSGLNANKVIIDKKNDRIFIFWKKNIQSL